MNTQDDSFDADELLDLLEEDEEEENPNEGVLEGMKCPKCGSFGPFQIEITTVMIVNDEGVDEQCGDNEWNDESYCQCLDCDNSGTVATFSGEEAKPVKPSPEEINQELLKALKDADERLSYLMPERWDDAAHKQAYMDMLARNEAIIAKAEGK